MASASAPDTPAVPPENSVRFMVGASAANCWCLALESSPELTHFTPAMNFPTGAGFPGFTSLRSLLCYERAPVRTDY